MRFSEFVFLLLLAVACGSKSNDGDSGATGTASAGQTEDDSSISGTGSLNPEGGDSSAIVADSMPTDGGEKSDAPSNIDQLEGDGILWEGATYDVKQEISGACSVHVSFLSPDPFICTLGLTNPPTSGTVKVDRLTPSSEQCQDLNLYIFLNTREENWYGLEGEVTAEPVAQGTRYTVVAELGADIEGKGETAPLVARFVISP